MKTRKKSLMLILLVTIATLLFILGVMNFFIWKRDDLAPQLIGALFGTIATAVITVLLLNTQTSIEENKDIGVSVFGKKQEIYLQFIDFLQEITKDNKISEEELQALIYQLSLIQMHADSKIAEQVCGYVGDLIVQLKELNEKDSQKTTIYSCMAETIFSIVSVLKEDLYGKVEDNVEIKPQVYFKQIIYQSSLFNDLPSYEDWVNTQMLFWKGLAKRFIAEKFEIKYGNDTNSNEITLKKQVEDYYSYQRPRYDKDIYLAIELFKDKETSIPVYFEIWLPAKENYYLLCFSPENGKNDQETINIRKQLTKKYFTCLPDTLGYTADGECYFSKYPSQEFLIDFWNLTGGWNKLVSRTKKEEFVSEIYKAMREDISLFMKNAKKTKYY